MNQNLLGAVFGVALLFIIGVVSHSHYAAGRISSIQNDQDGKPAWVYGQGWIYQEANQTVGGAAGAPPQGGGQQQPQQLARSQGGAQPPVCILPEVLNPETNQCEAPQPPPADDGAAAPPGEVFFPLEPHEQIGGGGGGNNNEGGGGGGGN